MKRLALLLLMGVTVASATFAQAPATSPAVTTGASAGASVMTDGEVRKVDKSAKKITLRHGPIQNLDMPAMTMVFQVPDAALLDGLAVGDKLRFHAEQQNGATIVTHVEKVGN